ncbi:MAG: trypsin-like serine protease [Phycisphaera sp.]|nr:trypsin-like serine protease [Phycisphaera sp.]
MSINRFIVRSTVVAIAVGLLMSGPCAARVRAEGLPSAVRERLHQATVLIEARYRPIGEPDAKMTGSAQGSGFVIAGEGLIVTNAHCVDPTMVIDLSTGKAADGDTPVERRMVMTLSEVEVRLRSGRPDTRVYAASLLCSRPFPTDLAILRIHPDAPLTALELLPNDAFAGIAETDSVWAIGFPLGTAPEAILAGQPKLDRNPNGIDLSFRGGSIRSLRLAENGQVKAIDHSCEITHGNSGGPLVDAQGRVVGVNYYGGATFSFAIPIPLVRETLKRLFEYRLGEGAKADEIDGAVHAVAPGDKAFDRIQELALSHKLGTTIALGAGDYRVDRLLRLSSLGMYLRGAGRDKTRLVLGPKGRIECHNYCAEVSDLTIVVDDPAGDGKALRAMSEADLYEMRLRNVAFGASDVSRVRMIGTNAANLFLHDVTIETQNLPGLGVACNNGTVDVTRVTARIAHEDEAKAVVVRGVGQNATDSTPRFIGCDFERVESDGAVSPSYLACRFFAKGLGLPAHDAALLSALSGAQATVDGCWFDVPDQDPDTVFGAVGLTVHAARLNASDNLFDLWAAKRLNDEGGSVIMPGFPGARDACGIDILPGSRGEIRHNLFRARRGPSSVHDLPWPIRSRGKGEVGGYRSKLRCYNFAYGLRADFDGRANYVTPTDWVIRDNLFDNAGWVSVHNLDLQSGGDKGTMPEADRQAWYEAMKNNTYIRTPVDR